MFIDLNKQPPTKTTHLEKHLSNAIYNYLYLNHFLFWLQPSQRREANNLELIFHWYWKVYGSHLALPFHTSLLVC